MRLLTFSFILINLYVLQALAFQPVGSRERAYVPTHLPQVVLVLTDAGRCTGFIVGQDTLMTAAHCFQTKELNQVVVAQFETDKSQAPFVLYAIGDGGTSEDWALLAGPTGDIEPLEFASPSDPTELPEPCLFYGYTGTELQKAMPAALSGYEDPFMLGEVMVLIGVADFGDSGGPILSVDNKIVGLLFALSTVEKSIAFGVKGSVLVKAMTQHPNPALR